VTQPTQTTQITHRWILALLCGLCWTGATAAQPPPAAAPTAGVEVEALIDYALAHNQQLAAERQRIAEALGRLKQAGLKANPMLEGSGQTSLPESGMQNIAIGLSLPLEVGRRSRRLSVASEEVARMRHEVANQERLLAGAIGRKAAELAEIEARLALLRELAKLHTESLSLIRARVAEGVSPRLEENLQIVELRQTEAQRAMLDARHRALLEELKGQLGWSEETPLALGPALATRVELPPRERLIEEALSRRPDLAAARADEAIGEAMIAMATVEGTFDVSVFGELGWQRWRFDQQGFTAMAGGGNLLSPVQMQTGMIRGGVTLTLPVRNRNQGSIEAAVAWRQSAKHRREFLESIVRREIAAADERRQGARQALAAYDEGLIQAQEANTAIVRESYTLGHARLTDLLAEQRRLVALRLERLEALKERFLSDVELAEASSQPLPSKRPSSPQPESTETKEPR
jgi:cobalt-zinc-cadmium efflux system outer membrane protein